ncbi:HNH endonuclease [Burkholderia pseudomallei]|uniref:HNH endonuclease n=1 Tax=Burkholderia pseudomallei TaxID=28450 RepID=UPI003C7DA104
MREVVSASSQRLARDLTGRKFGRLTAIERAGRSEEGVILWKCTCECGGNKVVRSTYLLQGNTLSCGCARGGRQTPITPKLIREKRNILWHSRRARIAAAGGTFTKSDIDEIFRRQKGKCAWCGASIKNGFHRDHRVPLAKGGSNDRSNIDLLCPKCNVRKSNKDPIKWAQEQGKLL